VNPSAKVRHAEVLIADRALEDFVRRLVGSADFADEGLLRFRRRSLVRLIHEAPGYGVLKEFFDGLDDLPEQQQ